MMKQLGEVSEGGKLYHSTMTMPFNTCTQPISCQLGLKYNPGCENQEGLVSNKYVEASMGRGILYKIVDTGTSVGTVAMPNTVEWSVLKESWGVMVKPKYLCFNCWDLDGKPLP
jgi:hypothetical protein